MYQRCQNSVTWYLRGNRPNTLLYIYLGFRHSLHTSYPTITMAFHKTQAKVQSIKQPEKEPSTPKTRTSPSFQEPKDDIYNPFPTPCPLSRTQEAEGGGSFTRNRDISPSLLVYLMYFSCSFRRWQLGASNELIMLTENPSFFPGDLFGNLSAHGPREGGHEGHFCVRMCQLSRVVGSRWVGVSSGDDFSTLAVMVRRPRW